MKPGVTRFRLRPLGLAVVATTFALLAGCAAPPDLGATLTDFLMDLGRGALAALLL